VGELAGVLIMEKHEFEFQYNAEKPEKTSHIVFSCLMGGRAEQAADLAQKMGYVNASFYPGSWREWSSKTTN